MEKRTYVKPGIVYCDFKTGEMTGSQFMIDKIISETEKLEKEQGALKNCPFEDTAHSCDRRIV